MERSSRAGGGLMSMAVWQYDWERHWEPSPDQFPRPLQRFTQLCGGLGPNQGFVFL